MKSQFTLNRMGTFSTKLTVSNQCKAPGHKKYNYTFRAVCGLRLDNDGFVIDHARVDQQIQLATVRADSCERLCLLIADRLRNVFLFHGAELKEIYIKVSPVLRGKATPVAFMEYDQKF